MKLTNRNPALLKRKYRGYLEGKRATDFFRDFGIKFAAGHWAAGGKGAQRIQDGAVATGSDASAPLL